METFNSTTLYNEVMKVKALPFEDRSAFLKTCKIVEPNDFNLNGDLINREYIMILTEG